MLYVKGRRDMLRAFSAAFVILWTALAAALNDPGEPRPLKVYEVLGVRTRAGRHLQQAFGSSSIVPMVIDDSPCVSFNADDSSPILDASGGIIGYTTVHSNGYDSAGLSVLRLDLVTINVGATYYFASVGSTAANGTNVRVAMGTGLPDACPSTNPASRRNTQGVALNCNKRRATLDISVPTTLFNCTVGTTEDFNIVFFLQIEVNLATQQCSTSREPPFFSGSVYNAMPSGSGCSYIMVTAACKPSTCPVDRSSLSQDELLTIALGATGRIDGRSQQLSSYSRYSTGLSGLRAAVVGGIVGGVITAVAVAMLYVMLKRSAATPGGRVKRSRSVASDYLDADKYDDSFTIDTGGGSGDGGRGFGISALRAKHRCDGGRHNSRTSAPGRLSRLSELRAMGAGRWRDKFGSTTAAAANATSGVGAAGACASEIIPARDGCGNEPFGGVSETPRIPAGRNRSIGFASSARLPSMFLGQRTASVFAQPGSASPTATPPDSTPMQPHMAIAAPHRSSNLVGSAAAVPMIIGRAAGGGGSGMAPEMDELAPPVNASTVFLNPLALLRGGFGGGGGRRGSISMSYSGLIKSVIASRTSVGLSMSGVAGGNDSGNSGADSSGKPPERTAFMSTLAEVAEEQEPSRPTWRLSGRSSMPEIMPLVPTTGKGGAAATEEPLEASIPDADKDTTPLLGRRVGALTTSSVSPYSWGSGPGPVAEGVVREPEGVNAAAQSRFVIPVDIGKCSGSPMIVAPSLPLTLPPSLSEAQVAKTMTSVQVPSALPSGIRPLVLPPPLVLRPGTRSARSLQAAAAIGPATSAVKGTAAGAAGGTASEENSFESGMH